VTFTKCLQCILVKFITWQFTFVIPPPILRKLWKFSVASMWQLIHKKLKLVTIIASVKGRSFPPVSLNDSGTEVSFFKPPMWIKHYNLLELFECINSHFSFCSVLINSIWESIKKKQYNNNFKDISNQIISPFQSATDAEETQPVWGTFPLNNQPQTSEGKRAAF
jgi:hypothetical protein